MRWPAGKPGAVGFFFGADHVHYRVDQRQVGERLREVAQMTAGARLELLGVEVQRAGKRQQPLAQMLGAADFPISTSADTSQNEQMVKVPSSPVSPSSVSSTR
ncbi:hypothetical protein I553_7687 [Mycobacterium xenopi 4042]|uniref:Uncharacterized protein n=1 Tax=Mycobacterium xenopi 4042 TaxID=1299334 RepID=X8AN32_MYCXE|nr:hypothetical protein I553_7687 [Mycobacterium xenopi 4042]